MCEFRPSWTAATAESRAPSGGRAGRTHTPDCTRALDRRPPPGLCSLPTVSRAFAKLAEAELRLGRRIAARDTCVDLGASPGSWTYVAVRRGARVTAVDRADLREDLMQHKNVRFERGDAFRFEPASPVDWLLCDVQRFPSSPRPPLPEGERIAVCARTWFAGAVQAMCRGQLRRVGNPRDTQAPGERVRRQRAHRSSS